MTFDFRPGHGKPLLPQPEWVKRFAYRAMLVQPSIDSLSARMIADSQFDEAGDLEPETAAEIFTGVAGNGPQGTEVA